MKLLSRAICLIICLLSANLLFSQEMSFETLTHDFGVIAEDGGTVSYSFRYKSSGKSPVVIVTAVSSCGCTTPVYSRRPVAVGDWSTIDVTYDPMDRPGKFSKTIQVVIAPHNKKYVLTITGDVTPRIKSREELYPFDMGGGLRIKSNYYPLSLIEQGERREVLVEYVNTSKRPIRVALDSEESKGDLFESSFPLTIAAGETGSVAVAYDLKRNAGFYGAISDKFFVEVNGSRSDYKLMFNAHAVDRFTPDQAARPASSTLSSRIIKLGNVKKGRDSVKASFTIENTGVTPLTVRQVDLGGGIATSLKAGDQVAAGEERKFNVWVRSRDIAIGNFTRYMILTVTDPDEPMQRIRVSGTVIE